MLSAKELVIKGECDPEDVIVGEDDPPSYEWISLPESWPVQLFPAVPLSILVFICMFNSSFAQCGLFFLNFPNATMEVLLSFVEPRDQRNK